MLVKGFQTIRTVRLSWLAATAATALACSNDDSDPGVDDAGLDVDAGDDLFGATPEIAVEEEDAGPPTPVNPLVVCETAVGGEGSTQIDDFEDEDLFTDVTDGREGSWYSYGDETEGGSHEFLVAAIPDGRDDSEYALRFSGSGYLDWGAGMGVDLRWTETGDEACLYDASAYDGFSFWARGSGESVRLIVQNPFIVPVSSGGDCEMGCWDSHGVDLTLEDEWQLVEIRFDDLEQAGWGEALGGPPGADFDPSVIRSIEFTTAGDVDFDYWIDDVTFFQGEGSVTDDGGADSGDAGLDGGVTPSDAGSVVSSDAGTGTSDAGLGDASVQSP